MIIIRQRNVHHCLQFQTLKHEPSLLLNEGIPRALKGKKLRLKNILLLPLIWVLRSVYFLFSGYE